MQMNFFDKVIYFTKKIPKGLVATYGQVAGLCGSPRGARAVGWALHGLPESKLSQIPWQRVINRQGRISTTCQNHTKDEQAGLLKKEKIVVIYKDGNYFVDLKKYLWKT